MAKKHVKRYSQNMLSAFNVRMHIQFSQTLREQNC